MACASVCHMIALKIKLTKAYQLLLLKGEKVDACWESVNVSPPVAQVEDANLGVGHTTAEAGLGVRLVLAVPIATSGTATHGDCRN